MKISQAGIDLIKRFEGLKLEAYHDGGGVLTIGYGHTGPDVVIGEKIDQSGAEKLLAKDLERFEHGVSSWVDVSLTQNQFDALVSFSFNAGLTAFQSSTMLRKLLALDYVGAASEFARWNHVQGKVLPGLTARRAAERELFLTPDPQVTA